jgi:hypothetical protein
MSKRMARVDSTLHKYEAEIKERTGQVYKLLKKKSRNTLDFHNATAKSVQARMLKLHTCTPQTPALIVKAWCAACATLDCVTEHKKRSQVEKVDCVLMPQHFYHSKFLTEKCTANVTIEALTVNILHW